MGSRIAGRALMALYLAGPACAAAADDTVPIHPALTDQFYFAVGVYYPSTSTSVQLNSTRLGAGTNVEFEDALGMERSKAVPVLSGRLRLGERWRVEAEYFELNRNGHRQIDRQIQWGDHTFPVNAQVDSQFNFSDLRISAGYAFFRTKDKEFGAGLGVHVASYKASLTGTFNGNEVGSQTEAVTAPLPVIGLYGQVALTEHWAVGGRFDRFSLNYRNVDGSLTALGIDLQYQPFRHVGFGLGMRSLFLSLDATGEHATVKFRQSFQGPVAFMNVSF